MSWSFVLSAVLALGPSPLAAAPSSVTAAASLAQPAGASFLSPTEGYLLEDFACRGRPAGASPCLAMAFTDDGGRSWRPLAAPSVAFFWGLSPGSGQVRTSVSEVDFANTNDGYLFNPGLEVTQNGSRTWLDAKLGDVSDLVTTRNYAFALTTQTTANGAVTQELWRAGLGSARWDRVPMPNSDVSTELVADDGEVLLLGLPAPYSAVTGRDQPGRIWVGGNPGQRWRVASSPCIPKENGAAAALAVPPGRPADWALDCTLDNQSSQAMYVEHSIFVSSDSGKHWRLAGNAPHRGGDVALAWNGGSDFLLATEGATDQLDASGDGGRTWSSPIADGGDFYGWANLDFVGQYTALVVGPTHYGYPGHPARLGRTDDGGAAWSSVPMPPPRLNQRSMVANLVTAPALGRGHQPDHEPRQLAHTVGPHGPPPDRNVERGHLVHPRRPRPLIAASGPGRSDPSTAGLTPGDIAIMAKEDHATVVGGPRKRQAQAHLDSTLWANADQYRRAETMGIWLQRIRATI